MSLDDVLTCSVRRMGALLRWLPPEAALWADTPAGWTIERELAAATVELLGEVVRGLSAQVARRRSDVPRSIKIPRPVEHGAEVPARRFDPVAFTAWLSLASSGGERA